MHAKLSPAKIGLALAAAVLTMGAALPATAAPTASADDGPSTKDVPQCVWAWSNEYDDVIVHNACGNYQRYKVVMAFGPDLPCATLAPGQEHSWRDPSGRFDGLVSC
ncbi:hypothetical protein DEO23_03700 [Brachybacterium endophyticum]|uniref:Alpha-amlyase n=1 Tax=Brachybacterium endophyticum TaxID=2182385 RepID=A0A2U2RPF2_9MICO|nr:hypothetical protein [Brachybacterium endophyticum]PWH07730.1 hypothetical protein DEO23_03700 [Brachybacterium endophyticum]